MTAASVGRGARAAGAHRHRRVTRPYGAAVRHFSKGRSRENSALILDAQLHLFDGAASAIGPLSKAAGHLQQLRRPRRNHRPR
jgi:hypothetical protein